MVTLLDRGALAGPFDLILADPPFRLNEHGRFLAAAGRHRPVIPGGLLILEDEATKTRASGPDPSGFTHFRRAVYGRSILHFYEAVVDG